MYALEHYEEIDDVYKKKQKRKLAGFITILSLAVIFAVGGFTLNYFAAQKATDTYQNLMSDAAKATDYNRKIKLYGQAIAVPNKAGRKMPTLA